MIVVVVGVVICFVLDMLRCLLLGFIFAVLYVPLLVLVVFIYYIALNRRAAATSATARCSSRR